MTPPAAELRLTWVQPEDLLGHELRQAAEDGRDPAGVRRRWLAAGGRLAPDRAGASAGPTPPALRALAESLLDELGAASSPLAAAEPTDLAAIHALAPAWSPLPEVPAGTGTAPEEGSPAHRAERPSDRDTRTRLAARLEAAWLGRAAGCLLGKPVEKLTLAGIREIARGTGNWPLDGWFTGAGLDPDVAARHPWNRRSAATSLAENISGMPEDDDLDYPLLGLLLLEAHGHGFGTADVARLWLAELPAGRTFTAERVAYRNLLDGVEPPHTATRRNPFREWIGALIRADVHGWTHPGDPVAAADQVWRDAVLTHTACGVHGAMFAAAVIAAAAGGRADVHDCLAAGLGVVPGGSRLARAVRFGIEAARAEPTGTAAGFADVVDALHAAHGDHHWVHVLPNASLLAAALTHAGGDFSGSITRAVSGGWDTDSNGATAGSVAGLLAGSPAALPDRWTGPLKNRLSTTVGGLDGIGFDTLARRTAALAVLPQEGTS
ncbi:ADP-ribosylglycohydrolase family protein [Streptomyces cocklensis]|uniref:ADP-ribosylglycohydrolase n=1 Tax=Actinacidiphila cocklensis TaxID=887465 RepID=A0A9W4GN41_9ACTN|nr:ADP-ribosylglycohydrolase family protein [Actinacidiphila cocklensis]MDD1063609.1 ADP-ribosylglycohydrolase family protein [Actinacidiphila cocklensis]WSX72992.1 ADP-ribosylglycohydrolase family protein [Streptomyces sp. NBC_00899]WSX80942.1 ADP-ribosylglycohydrolase family protein [Streptomyces sp. NBC_00899]CAG6390973.1 ADP-ribosylglycohydrolase [Actinacidiphila cocklensis]